MHYSLWFKNALTDKNANRKHCTQSTTVSAFCYLYQSGSRSLEYILETWGDFRLIQWWGHTTGCPPIHGTVLYNKELLQRTVILVF